MTERQQAFHDLAPRIVDLDVADNGIISYADRRLVFFHTKMFAKLFKNMEDVAGPVIKRKIKEFGSNAGHTIASKLDEEFKQSSRFDELKLILQSRDMDALRKISDMDDLAQIEKILGLGTYDGWVGDVTFDTYEEGKKAIFEAENTFESYSYGETGDKECKFITGVVEGILGYFWETDITAEELQCACEGHDTCRIRAEAENA
ncbi:MAG: 4-vinyl reductase [Candidatus Nanohaloarchaea archaeon]|nr:4-vinyl reductase [Candidatus Nanohaloarchaea archaeon]